MSNLQPIVGPKTNWHANDAEVAATLAERQGWQTDAQGVVYDERCARLARDLNALGQVIRSLGWLVPSSAQTTGIDWKSLPDDEANWGAAVQAESKRMGLS